PHDGLLIYQKNWRGDKPRVGQTIWGGRKLGKLPDLSSMEAKAFVLESEAAGLKEKLPVSIMLEAAPGKVFRGEITSIVSIAKPMEQQSPLKYFEVKVKIDNKDNYKMKPGSRLNAVIYVSKLENVITVPNQALFFHDEKVFVNVEDGSGFDEKVVEIGIRSLTKTVIKKGLEVGDRILLGKLSGANAGSGKGE
ncbi:MAG: HlyD family efflux transporter periplasmic adaptor subunit, partial [bacterium]|nr:HlyD family efflux transporter periplasmic adaptor subunit [bacterium]